MDVKVKNSNGVALAAKVFGILDLFQLEKPSWSQAEIVSATGMNRSTVNRLIRFLSEIRFLVLIESEGRYRLGSAAAELGNRATASFDLRGLCRPILERLSAQINETVVLTALDPTNFTSICVDQIESQNQGLRAFEKIGATYPLHAGAAPKAILAWLPADLQARYLSKTLDKLTQHTLTTRRSLLADIKATRARGYALSREETYEGTVGAAAPILNAQTEVIASLAVALPIHRGTDARLKELGGMLAAAATEISQSIWEI